MTLRLEDFPDDTVDPYPLAAKPRAPRGRLSNYTGGRGARTNLPIVEEVLRAAGRPLKVRQILDIAGDRFPTKSVDPYKVVGRDICLNIVEHGELSTFVRIAPGTFDLRERVSK